VKYAQLKISYFLKLEFDIIHEQVILILVRIGTKKIVFWYESLKVAHYLDMKDC
jgi:hypothetical protein